MRILYEIFSIKNVLNKGQTNLTVGAIAETSPSGYHSLLTSECDIDLTPVGQTHRSNVFSVVGILCQPGHSNIVPNGGRMPIVVNLEVGRWHPDTLLGGL